MPVVISQPPISNNATTLQDDEKEINNNIRYWCIKAEQQQVKVPTGEFGKLSLIELRNSMIRARCNREMDNENTLPPVKPLQYIINTMNFLIYIMNKNVTPEELVAIMNANSGNARQPPNDNQSNDDDVNMDQHQHQNQNRGTLIQYTRQIGENNTYIRNMRKIASQLTIIALTLSLIHI